VDPGGTFTVDLVVRDPDLAFNAFDLSVHFDPAWLTLAPMSPVSQQRGALMVNACTLNAPFHVFTPGPDSAVCTLVILCDGVSVTGQVTIYLLSYVAAQEPSWTPHELLRGGPARRRGRQARGHGEDRLAGAGRRRPAGRRGRAGAGPGDAEPVASRPVAGGVVQPAAGRELRRGGAGSAGPARGR